MKNEKSEELLAKAESLPKHKYSKEPIDNEKSLLLAPSSYGITNSTSKVPILGSAALNTCLGLIILNKKTQAVLVSHFLRGVVTIDSDKFLRKSLESIRKTEKEAVEIHLIGMSYDENQNKGKWLEDIKKLLGAIDEAKNVELKTFDVGNKPHPSAIAVDTRKGEFKIIRGSTDIINKNHKKTSPKISDSFLKTDIVDADFLKNFLKTRVIEPRLAFDGTLRENQTHTGKHRKPDANKNFRSPSH